MPRLNMLTTLALVVAAGSLGWALSKSDPAPPPPPASEPPGVARDLATLRSHVRDLSGSVARLEEGQQDLEEAEADAAATTQAEVETAPRDPQEEAQAAQVNYGELLDAEAVDTSWGPQTENRLREKLSEASYARLGLTGVECRSTMCRVDLQPEDATLAMGMLRKLPIELDWTGSGMLSPDPDRPGALVLYMAREGMSLPGSG